MLTGNHIQAYLTRTARDNNNKQKHKREQVNRLLELVWMIARSPKYREYSGSRGFLCNSSVIGLLKRNVEKDMTFLFLAVAVSYSH